MFQMEDYECSPAVAGSRCEGMLRFNNDGTSHQVQYTRPTDDVKLAYHWFRSSKPRSDLPLFFAVHGIGRRAEDQARLFAPFIEKIGGTIIAPVFEKRRFAGYQRFKQSKLDIRSDLAFRQLVAHAHLKFGSPHIPIVLFGYSGGGQFVHRYAMAYPRQVKRLAIAAPGWFTFPDKGIRFPRGVAETTSLPDLSFDSARFLKIPSLVLVGDKDVGRDKSLNKRRDIDAQQGRHRLERALCWIDAMRSAAGRYQYETHFQLDILPGCAHSFRDCMANGQMGWAVTRFLFTGNL